MFDFLKHIYFMFFIVSLASMFVTIMVTVTAKEVAEVMNMSVRVEVICKETNKTVWSETHKSETEANRAIEQMMLNHFNSANFKFRKGVN